jgi:hypothetical protein
VTSTSTKTNLWGWKLIAKVIGMDDLMVAEDMVVVMQRWGRSTSSGDGNNTKMA